MADQASPPVLRLTSCQAPNAEPALRGVLQFISQQTGLAIDFVTDLPWQARAAQLDSGQIHAGWVCGVPYVWRVDRPDPQVELLVAPVMRPPRYQGRPIYFSDVVVHQQSRFIQFADLRGASWAFNERTSHSGYHLTRYSLATRNLNGDFFGKVVEAGAHQRSLRWIMAGEVDAAAIDSTVLETELRQRPDLAAHIRIIDTFGPSPIPAWIVHRSVPPDVRERLRAGFLRLHEDSRGQTLLAAGDYLRFEAVGDRDYDPIREMLRLAEPVTL